MSETIYGNEVVFHTRVCEWFTRFRKGHENLEGDPRSGWPSTVRNPGTFGKYIALLNFTEKIRRV
jgi:hypothetical protein